MAPLTPITSDTDNSITFDLSDHIGINQQQHFISIFEDKAHYPSIMVIDDTDPFKRTLEFPNSAGAGMTLETKYYNLRFIEDWDLTRPSGFRRILKINEGEGFQPLIVKLIHNTVVVFDRIFEAMWEEVFQREGDMLTVLIGMSDLHLASETGQN